MATADIPLVCRYTADVVWGLRHQVGVQIGQRLPHLARVFLIDAEHDRFGKAILLFHKIGEVLRNRLRAGAQSDHTLEVLGQVLIVRDRSSVPIELVLAWAPAGCIPLSDHPVHAVRREEPVFDPLAQAILVNWIAEIPIGVATLDAQRRGRHSQLVGRLEILEDHAPGAIVAGAAAVIVPSRSQIAKRRIIRSAGPQARR